MVEMRMTGGVHRSLRSLRERPHVLLLGRKTAHAAYLAGMLEGQTLSATAPTIRVENGNSQDLLCCIY